MFETVVKQRAQTDESASTQRDHHPDQIELYDKLHRLMAMTPEESLDRCFQFFWNELWSNTRFRKAHVAKQRYFKLMKEVATEKINNVHNDKLPPMATIAHILQDIGHFKIGRAQKMVIALIEGIVASSSLRADYANDETHQQALARKQGLLEDLVDTWIVISRNGLNPDSSSLSTSQEAQFRLPEINSTQLEGLAQDGNTPKALDSMFAKTMSSHSHKIYAATLATFVLLVDPDHSNPSIRQKAKPFLVSVARVLAACELKQSQLVRIFKEDAQILWYVVKRWSPIVKQLQYWIASPGRDTVELEDRIINGEFGESVSVDPDYFLRRLASALLMGDLESVEALWVQYWGDSPAPDEKRAAEMRQRPDLFNSFITNFTALRRPQRALDVWNAMNRIGIEATLETWMAMIEGFRRARNAVGLEGVWQKLAAAKIPLNERVWRTRISGLMDCRKPEAGLRALKELAKQSKKPNGVPFTIDSVNAVIGGLIRLNSMNSATEVLNWASARGVSPDIFTFNLFLRPLLKDRKLAQAQKILEVMRAQGVQPDAATFTALLDNVIDAASDQTPDEGMAMLWHFINNMDHAGVELNVDTLGRMIHLIIRNGFQTDHHTQGAVGTLLEHAKKKGLRLSRHIYTILVDFYFSQDPPASEEVNELIMDVDGLFLSANGSLDRVFWERVIKGFALAGDEDRAFELFQQFSKLGTALTLDCLEVLLRCLVGKKKVIEAGQLVAAVEKDRRDSSPKREGSETDRYWRHGFWGFARDYGLLSETA